MTPRIMEAILLLYRDEVLRAFELGASGLEVGSGPGCDVVIHDAAVAERHFLVRRDGHRVVAIDLRDTAERRERALVPGEKVAIGSRHEIVRVPDAPTRPRQGAIQTEPIPLRADDEPRLSLLIGRGGDARRVSIGGRPIVIGTGEACDVVLFDRAVSARHCRIEPGESGVLVRDLGSRNGTHVDGVRSWVARVGPGTRLRLGRTDLQLVARGESGDARSDGLIAASPAMLEVLGKVELLARLSSTVLVLGESGSGKEGIARALHLRGPRRDKPFVAVNAGGLPRDLIEAELFGHEKGAFTGALAQRRGVFEQAHGGTLFLDEIGELPLALQARLLRVLDTGEIRRVGSESTMRVDVRVVCATHRELGEMIADKTFREDLYYRLALHVVRVPPLRARPEDIRALAAHFVAAASVDVGAREISEAAIARLRAHGWPGNVRELRNVIENAAAGAARVIDVVDVERAIAEIAGPRGGLGRVGALGLARAEGSITELVDRYGGNLSEASRASGIPRTTLRDRLRSEAAKRREGKAG
jgi:two-component system response regulator GlrR